MEHFCRSYSRISTTPHRDHGLDWWHHDNGDCFTSWLHFLVAIPAFLRHSLRKQGRLQASRVQDVIQRGSRRPRCIKAYCCLHSGEQCSPSWDALDRDDQPCFPCTFLLLPSLIYQVGLRVQLAGRFRSKREEAQAEGLRPFYSFTGRLHGQHGLLSASEAQGDRGLSMIVRLSEEEEVSHPRLAQRALFNFTVIRNLI